MDLTKCPWMCSFSWAHWCNLLPQPLVTRHPDVNSLRCKKQLLVSILNKFLLVLMHTPCSSLALDNDWSRLAVKRPPSRRSGSYPPIHYLLKDQHIVLSPHSILRSPCPFSFSLQGNFFTLLVACPSWYLFYIPYDFLKLWRPETQRTQKTHQGFMQEQNSAFWFALSTFLMMSNMLLAFWLPLRPNDQLNVQHWVSTI